LIFFGNFPLLEFFSAVTGREIDFSEALKIGARIQTLRQCFNIREGIKPSEIKLPPRIVGIPPMSEGPLSGITIDIESLSSEYYKAMGWDPVSGFPTESRLLSLGIKDLVGFR
jgi:aldehyde:ferredoxin oxidoreductase